MKLFPIPWSIIWELKRMTMALTIVKMTMMRVIVIAMTTKLLKGKNLGVLVEERKSQKIMLTKKMFIFFISSKFFKKKDKKPHKKSGEAKKGAEEKPECK